MISVFERNEKKCVIDLSTADRLASVFSEYMEGTIIAVTAKAIA